MGAETLQARMEAFAGVTVTYRRPGEFSFSIVAVPGRNPVEIQDHTGVVLRGQVQDFTFEIAKLKAGMTADPQKPMRNDEIVMELNRSRVIFIVNAEDFSTSHYETSDSYGVAWRVHTKSDRIT